MTKKQAVEILIKKLQQKGCEVEYTTLNTISVTDTEDCTEVFTFSDFGNV